MLAAHRRDTAVACLSRLLRGLLLKSVVLRQGVIVCASSGVSRLSKFRELESRASFVLVWLVGGMYVSAAYATYSKNQNILDN